jgi:hypothetical protein
MMDSWKLTLVEAIAEVGNGREKAQKAQEKAVFPHLLVFCVSLRQVLQLAQ